jgi:CMP-N,N'-diacetyllegionaminic acid synthase
MKILVIIPAKTDSTRLPKKNIQKIKGKTLVEYSIDYAKQSKYNPEIIVSSESDDVLKIALDNKVGFTERPAHLLKDAEVTDVYIDILKNTTSKYDLIVCLQPDHPDREHTFDYCIDYMINNNYDDLITIEPSFKRSGSVRIFKYGHLLNSNVSKRIGCIKDDATDIHYQQDLERAKKRL